MESQTPTHEHDCTTCQYLGSYEYKGATYDLYFCNSQGLSKTPTVIARYGEDGDYLSGMRFARSAVQDGDLSYPLAEAYMRSAKKGLL